jgi:hypothetical protein
MENKLHTQIGLCSFLQPFLLSFVFIVSSWTLTSETIDGGILDGYNGALFHCFLRLPFGMSFACECLEKEGIFGCIR